MAFDAEAAEANSKKGKKEAAKLKKKGYNSYNNITPTLQQDETPPPLPTLSSLFAGPTYGEKGSFAEALSKASEQNRHVLVNINHGDDFLSHELNRDVWVHDLVSELVVNNFIFWQR